MQRLTVPPGYSSRAARLFAGILTAIAPWTASAHVKWFAPYDVAANPAALANLFSQTFLLLAVSSILVFWLFCCIERSAVGRVLLRSLDQLGSTLNGRSDDLIRAGTAAFFIAAFGYCKVVLTP